jgi:hypothetical protein
MSATRSSPSAPAPAGAPVLGAAGTRLTLDGRPFPLTGVSFFNALYNPAFNRSAGERERRLRTFLDWGVNTLRVWCQWDFAPPRSFIDTAPEHSLYAPDGSLRAAHVATLLDLCAATAALGMALEVTLFSHEKQPQLPEDVLERGARAVAEHLRRTAPALER